MPKKYDDIYTDTFAELLEKFIILHIRTWHLEDNISNAIENKKSEKEIVRLKKKIDICFKEKRPMLIKAIDKMLFQVMKGKIKYKAENLKDYGK